MASTSTATPSQTEDPDVSSKIPPDNRIPATIITGFLGSGKVRFYPLPSSFLFLFLDFAGCLGNLIRIVRKLFFIFIALLEMLMFQAMVL